MAQQLSSIDLQALRSKGLLKESETAFKEGDMIIAEDLISKERRIINAAGVVLESTRQLLND